MEIIVNEDKVFKLLDTLLERWTAVPKKYPYNHKDAVIPQEIIPARIRNDKHRLSCFYFYICIYMRGGIKSLQAFNALIRMWDDNQELFDPLHAQWLQPEYVQKILAQYIGWDAKAASISWVENSRRLVQYWDGKPLKLITRLTNYDEAVRRMRNKLSKRERLAAGENGLGFRGFQYKMVSMLLYFYDWEGWLPKNFLYPAPADFHNFRLAFAHRGIVLDPQPEWIRAEEKYSKVWRKVLMQYLRAHRVRPVEVADALWLFSLVMCGNSPVTKFIVAKTNGSGMFGAEDLPHNDASVALAPRNRKALEQTCLSCPIVTTCELAIPAGPYYKGGNGLGGKLFLLNRPRVENQLTKFDPDHLLTMTQVESESQFVLPFLKE